MRAQDAPTAEQPTIRLNGVALQPDPAGVLLWPARRTLIVADLHLEKGSNYTRHGAGPLPPHDSTATLDRLAAALDRHRPDTVICLGDSFHDPGGPQRLDAAEGERLRALTARAHWIWIAGNHDPDPSPAFGGEVMQEHCAGGLVFRHIARTDALPAGEVSGHYHPKAKVRVRGRTLRRSCFVHDGRRLVLPAFGAYTGGLNVRDPAFQSLFAARFRVHVLGTQSVYGFSGDRLLS
ncbi:putative phosphoesterase [Limimonas halophila]|uniref:Putative phosphoesterase n=1 Tax=Limimonas halophila TaxID=1082479 RepID=A0A1G7L119_9PROT|nr:ligase-associated DNA damage response endonuclease PdeM [Limimonas halophila]SDF42780.1 putative phosphoesterase [Limimonas halophila]